MCLARIVTVSSAPIRTKAFGAGGAGDGVVPPCANADGKSSRKATRSAPAAAPRRTKRRLNWVISASRRLGRVADRGADAVVGDAAADIAGHAGLDVGLARARLLGEERDRRH